MTPYELVLVAREFCAVHRVRIVDYSALVAAAAVSNANIEGIAVHASRHDAARAIEKVLTQLGALSAMNLEFARVVSALYLSLTAES